MDSLVAFADIGEYFDQPTRVYSSGMISRLAFSICAHVDADVLIVDGVDINGVDDLIRTLDRDRIDRDLEMDVLRMGRLRAIDIHPIERQPVARQVSTPSSRGS